MTSQTVTGFWRPSTFALILVWVYSAGISLLFMIAAMQPNAGEWDVWSVIILSVYVLPALVIPFFLFHAYCENRPVAVRKFLPWAFRVVSLSVILAICDCWVAGTDRRDTLFSKGMWAMRDGGTRGYIGFGYCLTYHRAIGGQHGPEVWFWFTPFRLYWTSTRVGISWLWTREEA